MRIPTILLRLGRESSRKCSLTPLRDREDLPLTWKRHVPRRRVDVGEVTLLHPEGEPLSPADADRPLLVVDSSWRHLPGVLAEVDGLLHRRSLPPSLRTAYPRKSTTFEAPANGLASVEALHAALCLLGDRDDSLLEGYRWADDWLENNSGIFGGLP